MAIARFKLAERLLMHEVKQKKDKYVILLLKDTDTHEVLETYILKNPSKTKLGKVKTKIEGRFDGFEVSIEQESEACEIIEKELKPFIVDEWEFKEIGW